MIKVTVHDNSIVLKMALECEVTKACCLIFFTPLYKGVPGFKQDT